MQVVRFRRLVVISAASLLSSLPLGAQEGDLTDLFDQDPFYEQAGVLLGKGEIPFFADVSFLDGAGDSTQAVLGIALSNSAFQFLKERDGYRAAYQVDLRIEGSRGSFRNEWDETVRVTSFDETLINRETVVFQSAFGLLPGDYDLKLRVEDTQSGEETELEARLAVPEIAPAAGGYGLSKPVLLRFFGEAAAGGGREHVLYPSHYFERAPQDVSFFVEVYAAPGAGERPLRLAASLASAEGGAPVSNAVLEVPGLAVAGAVRTARVYGTVPGRGTQSGPYRLTLALQDEAGSTLAESSVSLSVSAATQWVQDNWERALEFLAYEASDEERDALEEMPPPRRMAAWTEFWEVRDPIPATPGNEAFENYFRRIATANANFTSKLRPGWKSDRGRVFVTLGPPTDIIRRPIPSGSFPLEIWVYDALGFEIVFEDKIGFGNYQIANPGTYTNELAALERRKHRAIAERRAQREEEDRREGQDDEAAPADTTRG